jgi:hypothetical protein
VAGSSWAAPATFPLRGVDAHCRHYVCGGDRHRSLLLPHGREFPAVSHSLLHPSGEEKRQLYAALVSKEDKVVSLPLGLVSPALLAASRALIQQASLGDPRGEAVHKVGSPTRATSPFHRSQFSPSPLSSRKGTLAVGCGVLSSPCGGAVVCVCVTMAGNSKCAYSIFHICDGG